MRILGIDPGATTGWCVYDSEAQKVLCVGEMACTPGRIQPIEYPTARQEVDVVAIESFEEARANIYREVVQAAIIEGRIRQDLSSRCIAPVHAMPRMEVKKILTAAMHGEIHVQKDKDVWQALLQLHGGDQSAKKGGPLYGVKSHARAALAVAVAWALRQDSCCFKQNVR